MAGVPSSAANLREISAGAEELHSLIVLHVVKARAGNGASRVKITPARIVIVSHTAIATRVVESGAITDWPRRACHVKMPMKLT